MACRDSFPIGETQPSSKAHGLADDSMACRDSFPIGETQPSSKAHGLADDSMACRDSFPIGEVQPSSKVHGLPGDRPAIVSPTPGLRQARRKRLESRLGQDGTVYQEGRKQTDEWLPDKPAYISIYLDIPGQYETVKNNNPLG